MTRDLRRERIVPNRITHRSRGRREVLGDSGVGGVSAPWDLAEDPEDLLLEGRLVGEGDLLEVWGEVFCLAFWRSCAGGIRRKREMS